MEIDCYLESDWKKFSWGKYQENDNDHLIFKDEEEENVPRVSCNKTNAYLSASLVGHEYTITQIKWDASYAYALLDDNSNYTYLLSSGIDKFVFLWYSDIKQQEHK